MSKLIVIPDSDPIQPWRYCCVIVTVNERYGGGDIDCSSLEVYKDFKEAHKKEIAWAEGDCYLVAKVPDDFDELSDKLPDEYEYEFTGTYDECLKYIDEATTHD